MYIPTAAVFAERIDLEFFERVRRFVNWHLYDTGVRPEKIDFYILDLSGPHLLGFVRRFNRECPQARLLVLLDSDSAMRDPGLLGKIRFTGILLKSSSSEIVEQAILQVTAGTAFFDPNLKGIYPIVDAEELGMKPRRPRLRRSVRLEPNGTIEGSADSATAAATAKIRRAWFAPPVYSTTVVVLSFALDEQCRPCKLIVVESSGEDRFEKAACAALEKVQLEELSTSGSFTVRFCVEART